MDAPLVTCLVPTVEKRRLFLPQVFDMFAHQTWPNKRMVVLDAGRSPFRCPRGVHRIAIPTDTYLGEALNIGVRRTKGDLFHKFDDDDWYDDDFLENLLPPVIAHPGTVSAASSYLVLLLHHWEIRVASQELLSGGTICFDRKAWLDRPFPSSWNGWGEDTNFIRDRVPLAKVKQPPWRYMVVRHGGNTWLQWCDVTKADDKFREFPLLAGGPEGFLPPEDCEFYRGLAAKLAKAA